MIESLVVDRLTEMTEKEEPKGSPWPEGCHGTRRALVIFLGPNPGGQKEDQREERLFEQTRTHWNDPFWEPIREWSPGFRKSFQPIVEAILGLPYSQAGKLISVLNMDWVSNPAAEDVSITAMREGCAQILPIIQESQPCLLVPMESRTYQVLQSGLLEAGFDLEPVWIDQVLIMSHSSETHSAYHRNLFAFQAKHEECRFLVIKSPQHPARIFEKEYAQRVGQAIRLAACQIWRGEAVNLLIV